MELDPFKRSIDEEDWDRNRDEKWLDIEDDAISGGVDRGEWEYQENVKDYGDYEYDEDGNEI